MHIQVIEPLKYAEYRYDLDYGTFRCAHINAEINRACCSPFQIGESGYVECGCRGMDSIYCPDCKNQDLEDHEVDEILNNCMEGAYDD